MAKDLTDISLITPDRVKFITPYKPTPAERKKIEDAFAYCVAKAAFWSAIYYNEMDLFYTTDFPYAATDSYSIYLNPPALCEWSIQQVGFVILHEISHKFLDDLVMKKRWMEQGSVTIPDGHGGVSSLPYDDDLMGCAKDYRINAMLVDGGFKMPPVGLYDRQLSAQGMESAVEIYIKLWQRCGGKPTKVVHIHLGGNGNGTPFDVHMLPHPQAVKDSESGKLVQVIAAAAQVGAGQGSMPAGLSQFINGTLNPKVPWGQFLKSTILRKGGDPTYDWSKFDKRLIMREPDPIFYARRESFGAGLVVIGYDSSGSCFDPTVQERFFAEMGGIIAELKPQRLVIMWCDAYVHRVDDLEDIEDLAEVRNDVPGGGGTDFRPVFEKIDEMDLRPDMLVYLTDMYGTFPAIEPDYPVVWASTTPDYNAPFGELVHVEL